MNAAKEVADATQLVENTGTIQQAISEPANPYMDMFGDEDMSDYSEVLLWRPYSKALGLTHGVATAAQHGNYGIGVTRGMVNGFLMANGLPVYAAGSGYQGDETISDVRKGRDSRLHIFLKEPGQINVLFESAEGDMAVPIEPFPVILNNNAEKGYSTGYALRKGNNYDQKYLGNGLCYTGALIFRGTEALLNYIEACYEKNGSLDNIAQSYWTQIRKRSHVDTDYNKTIAATDMAKEALNDWGAYSAGKLIDPTLYNIRRERRCELMAEGLRYMDLMRWRAMDQMISTPYHIEGFKLWEACSIGTIMKTVLRNWFMVWIILKPMFLTRLSVHTCVLMKRITTTWLKTAIAGLWLTIWNHTEFKIWISRQAAVPLRTHPSIKIHIGQQNPICLH